MTIKLRSESDSGFPAELFAASTIGKAIFDALNKSVGMTEVMTYESYVDMLIGNRVFTVRIPSDTESSSRIDLVAWERNDGTVDLKNNDGMHLFMTKSMYAEELIDSELGGPLPIGDSDFNVIEWLDTRLFGNVTSAEPAKEDDKYPTFHPGMEHEVHPPLRRKSASVEEPKAEPIEETKPEPAEEPKPEFPVAEFYKTAAQTVVAFDADTVLAIAKILPNNTGKFTDVSERDFRIQLMDVVFKQCNNIVKEVMRSGYPDGKTIRDRLTLDFGPGEIIHIGMVCNIEPGNIAIYLNYKPVGTGRMYVQV